MALPEIIPSILKFLSELLNKKEKRKEKDKVEVILKEQLSKCEDLNHKKDEKLEQKDQQIAILQKKFLQYHKFKSKGSPK